MGRILTLSIVPPDGVEGKEKVIVVDRQKIDGSGSRLNDAHHLKQREIPEIDPSNMTYFSRVLCKFLSPLDHSGRLSTNEEFYRKMA